MRLVLCLILAAIGCDESERSPSTRVEYPRILAVQADPPIATADAEVQLRALIATESGGVDDDIVRWRVCNPWTAVQAPDRDCPADASVELVSGRLLVSDVLARFPPPVDVDADALDGVGGGRCAIDTVLAEIPVLAEIEIAGQRAIAVKRIGLTVGDTIGARNPRLAEVRVEPGTDRVVTPELLSDSVDATCVDSVRAYFYSNGGSFEDEYTETEITADTIYPLPGTEWTADGDDGRALWIVLRTPDGGTGWAEASLR